MGLRGLVAEWWLEDQGGQSSGWQSRQSIFACGETWRNSWGARQTTQPGSQYQEIKPQNHCLKKLVRVEGAGETPSLIAEFVGETHRVPECTQNHPPCNEHKKGPICLWVAAEEVNENLWRAEQVALFPLRPLPHIEHHNTVKWVVLP